MVTEKEFGKRDNIEPLEGRAANATVVQIVAVDINGRPHA